MARGPTAGRNRGDAVHCPAIPWRAWNKARLNLTNALGGADIASSLHCDIPSLARMAAAQRFGMQSDRFAGEIAAIFSALVCSVLAAAECQTVGGVRFE